MDVCLASRLPRETVYVYGKVNGQATTWTKVSMVGVDPVDDVWETIASRSKDDVYRIELQVYKQDGSYYEAATTVYYGVLGLIFDRTKADVDRAAYLASLNWRTMTQAEKDEWSGLLKGFYNASDLNRVGTAVEYVTNRLQAAGYSVQTAPKTDWSVADIPVLEQMQTYLNNVRTLRSVFTVPPSMPDVPSDMEKLTWEEANNIERILFDLNTLITNIMSNWVQSGMVQSGQWFA